jgi:glycosyltransferase involved in cell wall biosynthesis
MLAPMSSIPAVSVLVPVYNAERYVAAAVESVLGQTFGDFELILLDDGSTDGSGRMLDEFAGRDGRIRVIHHSNRGICLTLEAGIEAARSDLLARMDADDLCPPDRLEKQVAYMREHPECVSCGGAILLIDQDGLPICIAPRPLEHEQIERELLKGVGGAIVHGAAIFRRDAIRRAGGYRDKYRHAEDLDLFLRLAEVGRLANPPDVVLHYRQHPASINATRHEEQFQLVEQIIAEAHQRRGIAVPEGWKNPLSLQSDPLRQRQSWVWMALKSGYPRTARKHALAVLRGAPLSVDSWRMMYCALRGR